MIAHDARSNCLDARPYFYDFLSEETRSSIPEEILEHISRCEDCRNNVYSLKNLLENPDTRRSCKQSQKDKAVIELLGLHLRYAGQKVRCGTVKQFIAGLADPTLAIRVATPITKHVEECSACREDLLYLRDLQLSHAQLCRLGQLLARKPSADEISCSQARPAIDSAASIAFQETNAEQLRHLCACPECREQLYQRREDICKRNKAVESELPCESISTCDIFDFCVPYGIDPADKNFIESQERLASHLRNCPTCLARMQEIHENIYHIVERPNSWGATRFSLSERSEPASAGITPATAALKLKRRLSAPHLKRYARLAAAAAAVIIIYVLLPGTPPAQALGPEFATAIKTVDNVHIAIHDPGKESLRQKKWISRSLGVEMLKTGDTYTLSSIPERVRMTAGIQNDKIRKVDLTEDEIAELRRTINGSLDIMPFEDMSSLPVGSEMKKLPNETLDTDGERVEKYELTFRTDLDFNRARFSRWLFFVNAETSLPYKVEVYSRSRAEEGYEMLTQLSIEYPDESEVKAVIESAF